MKPKHPSLTEKDIQKLILDWLAARRIFHYRNNSGAFRDERNHLYRFGATGSPDIVCVIAGVFVGIEVKGPRGKLSDDQMAFGTALVKAGGKYIVAKSLDDVIKEIQDKKVWTH